MQNAAVPEIKFQQISLKASVIDNSSLVNYNSVHTCMWLRTVCIVKKCHRVLDYFTGIWS